MKVGWYVGEAVNQVGCLVITSEEQAFSQQQPLLKQIQQTEQRISEATVLYQDKNQ